MQAPAPQPPPGGAAPYPVLVVHNAYRQRGGEDVVVEAEVQLLRQHGHAVHTYQRSNDEIGKMSDASAALQALWSRRTCRDITALIQAHQPALVHVHNSFPLVSPSVYWAAAQAGLPVVQTLHNFRLICPQAMLLRDGRVCEACVGRVPWRAVQHACYRGSIAQSLVAASVLQGHRLLGTWQHKVTRYIALNDFCRDRFIAGGLPAERIQVKPNFSDLPDAPPQPRAGFLFVGRLSAEKGLATLAQAMRQSHPDCQLTVIGSGPEAGQVEGQPRTRLLGPQSRSQVLAAMRSATAVLLPSLWYEAFPLVIVEALACGTPVICSRIGAMPSLVAQGATGLLFKAGDATDLAATLNWAQAQPEAMAHMGRQARAHYEQQLTGASNYRQLRSIYDGAIAELAAAGATQA